MLQADAPEGGELFVISGNVRDRESGEELREHALMRVPAGEEISVAASDAGVIGLSLDEDGLRALVTADDEALRQSINHSALTGAAYTYQEFSDAELEVYAQALETPQMQNVYALLKFFSLTLF